MPHVLQPRALSALLTQQASLVVWARRQPAHSSNMLTRGPIKGIENLLQADLQPKEHIISSAFAKYLID